MRNKFTKGIRMLAVGAAFIVAIIETKDLKEQTKHKKLAAKNGLEWREPSGIYEKYIKRPLDVALSLGAAVVLFPVMVVTAVLVRIKLGSPVIFTQQRPGLIDPVNGQEKIFKLYKFRTMTDERDSDGKLLPDEVRLTKFGAWLRSTSLDELPELFNIIKGDMAVIGPRPQLVRDMTFMTAEQRLRHTVRPGLSGLAQVKGRNAISWEGKLNTDLEYIKKITFKEDCWIVLETFKKVFKKEGITEEGQATALDYGDELLNNGMVSQKDYNEKRELAKKILKVSERRTVILMNCHDDDVYCFRQEIINRFIEEGYQVVISCPDGPKLKLMKNMDCIFENISIDRRGTNPINDTRLLLAYIKLIKKYKPCVVAAFTIKPNIYGSIAAQICRVPYINNITGLGSGFENGGLIQKIVKNLYKVALKKSKMVFFQNQSNLEIVKKLNILNSDFKLIPGSGVNTDRFEYLDYPEGGNGINGKTVVFNYIGRVLHDKGIDDYIEAAKTIKKEYPNTEFNIIGFIEPTENHYINELKDLECRGIVKYCGQQLDVRPYIKKSHAIIHPSTYGEGMSNVLLESASSGRAIITTDNPGCYETVEDGVTGFVYHGGNVTELVKRIKQFLELSNDSRETMGKLGRKRMEDFFSREIVVNEYSEIVNKQFD